MPDPNRKEEPHFRTVGSHKIGLHLTKTDGCLCVSVIKRSGPFSWKTALSLLLSALAILSYIYLAILLVLLVLLYELLLSIREEKVLIIKGLGYQICRTYSIRNSSSFIPYEQVQKIFINEVILRHKVVYILSLLVQDKDKQLKLVPLFKHILPKIDCLQIIYRAMKHFKDS